MTKTSTAITAILCLLVLAVVALSRSPEPPQGKESAVFKGEPLINAALQTAEFLLSPVGQAGATVQCSCGKECRVGVPSIYPDLAWRLQFFAALASRVKDPRYSEHLAALLERLTVATSKPPTTLTQIIFNTHQLAEAFTETHNSDILHFLFQGLEQARAHIAGSGGHFYDDRSPMLAASLSRAFFKAADILSDPENRALLRSKVNGLSEEALIATKNAYARHAEKALRAAEESAALGKSIYPDAPSLHLLSCYIVWAEAAGFTSTRDSSYKTKVTSLLKEAAFEKRSAEELQAMGVFQNIVPCIAAADEVANTDADFKLAASLRQKVMERQWDRPGEPICSGDGAFVSEFSISRRAVGTSNKNIPETSWAGFVLVRSRQ